MVNDSRKSRYMVKLRLMLLLITTHDLISVGNMWQLTMSYHKIIDGICLISRSTFSAKWF